MGFAQILREAKRNGRIINEREREAGQKERKAKSGRLHAGGYCSRLFVLALSYGAN